MKRIEKTSIHSDTRLLVFKKNETDVKTKCTRARACVYTYITLYVRPTSATRPPRRFWSSSGIGVWLGCVPREDRDLASSTDSYRTDPSFSVCAGPCPVSVIIGPHYIGTDQSPHVRTSVDNLAESAEYPDPRERFWTRPCRGDSSLRNVQTLLTNYTRNRNVRTWLTAKNLASGGPCLASGIPLVFDHSRFNNDDRVTEVVLPRLLPFLLSSLDVLSYIQCVPL